MTGAVWDKILDTTLVGSRSPHVREALFELLSDAWLHKPALQVPLLHAKRECVSRHDWAPPTLDGFAVVWQHGNHSCA